MHKRVESSFKFIGNIFREKFFFLRIDYGIEGRFIRCCHSYTNVVDTGENTESSMEHKIRFCTNRKMIKWATQPKTTIHICLFWLI